MNKILLAALLAVLMALPMTAQQADTSRKKIYDENIDPIEQIDQALERARAEGKFVVCQVGGNWCPWCLRFADFITGDTAVAQLIDENFVYIHVNYHPRKSKDNDRAQQMLKRLGNCGRFGYPVLVVLDHQGQVVHIQDSAYLEKDKSYDPEKVLSFFKHWTPKAVAGQ